MENQRPNSKSVKLNKCKSTRYRNRKKAALAALNLLNDSTVGTSSSLYDNSSNKFEFRIKSPTVEHNNLMFSTSDQSLDYISVSDSINSFESDLNTTNNSLLENGQDDLNSNTSEPEDFENDCENLNLTIALWALRYRISHKALSELLKSLKKFPSFSTKYLPKDARTLLNTPKSTSVQDMGNGTYYHFSIKSEVELLLQNDNENKTPKTLLLVVGIDGLPLTTNPPSQLWPILGYFFNVKEKRPNVFIIGAYFGKTKPSDSNSFLLQFVNEMNELFYTGVTFNNNHVNVILHALICDTPAKSFVLNTKGHTGKNSCVRCTITGEWSKKRVCFPDLDCPMRSHQSFITYEDKMYHLGETILTKIPKINISSSIPYDYMHLNCIGVLKKLLLFWVHKKHDLNLPSQLVTVIDNKLKFLSSYIPVEFQRKTNEYSRMHPMRDVNRWKASELRQCLLYTGIVVFQNIVKKEVYNHFVVLSVAIRILLVKCTDYFNNYANLLLRQFIVTFKSLYGQSYISHNIHALCHQAEDAKKYGSLETISAFPFENFMQPLKRDVRTGVKPLQQLIHRYEERRAYKLNINQTQFYKEGPINAVCQSDRPLISGTGFPHYTGWRFESFTVKINSANNCVKLKNGSVIIIENIATLKNNNETVIIGRRYEKMENFFTEPCLSSILEIYKVSNLSPLEYWYLKNIKEKLVRLPLGDNSNSSAVILPFLHLK